MKSLRPPLADLVFNFAGVSVANVGAEPDSKKQKSQGAEEGHNILVHKTENGPPATVHENQALDSPDAISPALQPNESVPTAASPATAVDPVPANTTEEERDTPAVGEQFGIRLWSVHIASACIITYGSMQGQSGERITHECCI